MWSALAIAIANHHRKEAVKINQVVSENKPREETNQEEFEICCCFLKKKKHNKKMKN